MRHIPDAVKATSEMRRVTRPGGVVATAMWDNTGGHRINQSLWDTAGVLDTTMKFPPKSESYGSPEELRSLWAGAGLTDIEVTDFVLPCEYSSFDENWLRHLLEGQGITAAYVRGFPKAIGSLCAHSSGKISAGIALMDLLHFGRKRGPCAVLCFSSESKFFVIQFVVAEL